MAMAGAIQVPPLDAPAIALSLSWQETGDVRHHWVAIEAPSCHADAMRRDRQNVSEWRPGDGEWSATGNERIALRTRGWVQPGGARRQTRPGSRHRSPFVG